ncbi:hypothetical protein SASC598P14_000810, partial [Snodgrassella alvi SCGC AB-598-P14]
KDIRELKKPARKLIDKIIQIKIKRISAE